LYYLSKSWSEFVSNDDMIQATSPDAANHAFHKSIFMLVTEECMQRYAELGYTAASF
jgi:hypothetical protein